VMIGNLVMDIDVQFVLPKEPSHLLVESLSRVSEV
jgi:hypothetical protein